MTAIGLGDRGKERALLLRGYVKGLVVFPRDDSDDRTFGERFALKDDLAIHDSSSGDFHD